MKGDLISVIITVYNREKYLAECLDSVRNQTYVNFEAIIVDDESTDNSLKIAQSYANIDNRFKVIASKHIGFPLAKNLGLDNCNGKYIIFLDSDDSAAPYWLETLYTILVNTGSDISACFFDEYYKNKLPDMPVDEYRKKPLAISEHSFTKMNLLYEATCSSYMWNKLVKKEIYDGIRFVDQMALSDISTTYKLFDKANKVVHINDKLVHYRRHEESMGNETVKKGLEYYIFRAGVLKEATMFVWNKYAQTRTMIRNVVIKELKTMEKAVGKEDFNKYIFCPEFETILRSIPLRSYVNKISVRKEYIQPNIS